MKSYIAFLTALIIHLSIFIFFSYSSNQSVDESIGEGGFNNSMKKQKGVTFDLAAMSFKKKAITLKKQIHSPTGSNLPSASANSEGSSSNNKGSGNSPNFENSITQYIEPVYPVIARKNGIEGSLMVKIKVDGNGVPAEFSLLKSSTHKMLDEAVLAVIPKWRFQKKINGDSYWVEKTVLFQIK